MAPSKLLVFDIETIPDTALLPSDFDPAKFPKCLHHVVVSVAILLASIERQNGSESYTVDELRVETRVAGEEPKLVRFLWNLISKHQPRLVTYNGRAFDLPVVQLRAMLHGASAGAFFQAGDKWNNYTTRYSAELHCDLLDQLGSHGAVRSAPSLNELAVALGLPGKISADGSQVAELMASGQLDQVAAYNLEDVVQTFVVYLRWALLTGRTSASMHNAAVQNLCTSLDGHDRQHLREFCAHWRRTASQRMFVPDPTPIVIAQETQIEPPGTPISPATNLLSS